MDRHNLYGDAMTKLAGVARGARLRQLAGQYAALHDADLEPLAWYATLASDA